MKPAVSIMPEREPVTIPARRSFSKKERAEIFLAHGGICGLCKQKITGAYEIEHRIPHALGGGDGRGNLYPAHGGCHASKTSIDRKDIAKARRRAGETCAGETKNPLRSRGFPDRCRKLGGTIGLTKAAARCAPSPEAPA